MGKFNPQSRTSQNDTENRGNAFNQNNLLEDNLFNNNLFSPFLQNNILNNSAASETDNAQIEELTGVNGILQTENDDENVEYKKEKSIDGSDIYIPATAIAYRLDGRQTITKPNGQKVSLPDKTLIRFLDGKNMFKAGYHKNGAFAGYKNFKTNDLYLGRRTEWKIPLDKPEYVIENAHSQLEGEKNANSQKVTLDPKPWLDLYNFYPDKKVLENAEKRIEGLELQTIDAGMGKEVNLDYYSVTIDKLPENYHNEVAFLTAIRTGMGDLLVGSAKSDLEYYEDDGYDEKKYNSDDPVGSVLRFNVYQGIPGFLLKANVDDLSVLTTRSNDNYWVFSTVYTPHDSYHPVSGHRQFGINKNADGTYIFYTRGVDVVTTEVDVLASSSVFEGADETWRTLMKNLVNYINENGGEARENYFISKRVPKKHVDKTNSEVRIANMKALTGN